MCEDSYSISADGIMDRKLHFILALSIFVAIFFMFEYHDSISDRKILIVQQFVNKKTKFLSNKWIILTTVAYPTSAVAALAAQQNWRIVVVADVKTPKDWNFTNCDFLSIDMQAELGYEIGNLIPFNSYTRKMIGYLYAIQHGAEWIYDTDDDNQPIGLGLLQFDLAMKSSGLSYGFTTSTSSKRNMFNPYEFWGQANIWPRGYPLENVKMQMFESEYHLCKISRTPIIQQGLVVKDPDVDAVYRLLHADAKDGLNVTFSQFTPPIALNPGTFCPFNSQNTLFHRDAFWALFLPISVTFRVTDIWRGYYAQKLLHLIDHRLGFYPANAMQKRNAHSYLADFEAEARLYSDSGRLIDFLSNWTCNFQTMSKCMMQLSSDFVSNGFWSTPDTELTEAWIKDLLSLDYIFPELPDGSLTRYNASDETSIGYQENDCRSASLHFSTENSSDGDKKEQLETYGGELKDWCNEVLPLDSALAQRLDKTVNFTTSAWQKLKKMALIISSNFPFGPSVSIMQHLYEPHFAIVIFCGTIVKKDIMETNGYLKLRQFSYINVTKTEINSGFRAYICTSKAIELRLQNIVGYLTIADDLAFNFYNDFDYSRFRLPGVGRSISYWWITQYGAAAMEKSIAVLQNRTAQHPGSPLAKAMDAYASAINGSDVYALLREPNVSGPADFYYLPKENESFFYELSMVFFEANLFHEIALPKIGAGLQWLKYYATGKLDMASYIHLWGNKRNKWEYYYSKDIISLHPMKLSYIYNAPDRQRYCTLIVRNYLDSISMSAYQ